MQLTQEFLDSIVFFDNKGNIIPRNKIGTFTRKECIDMGIDPNTNPYFLKSGD